MPEITVEVSPPYVCLFMSGRFVEDMKEDFKNWFIKAVEETFGLAGKNDVDFKIIATPIIFCSKKIVDIAVNINYTVGKDEYNTGKIFDPTEPEQEALIEKIKNEFDDIRKKYNLPHLSFSVWCIPHSNAAYKMWE